MGAIISIHTGSPGMQPISIRVSLKSVCPCSFITAFVPVGSSERRNVFASAALISTKIRQIAATPEKYATFAQIFIMPAKFYEQEVSAKLKDKRKLSIFLDALVFKHRKKLQTAQLTYIFCTDAYLLQMNQQFLKHNTLTDIITFDLSEDNNTLQGEIYISTERVAENAAKFGKSYNDELHRVIFHGALHLCGFKDKTTADREEMRRKEDLCLKQYFKG